MNPAFKEIAASIEQWENSITSGRLPSWAELPGLELYMDQVIILLSQYLGFIPLENGGKIITPGIINSYVRQKLIPPPQKKKYSRIHMAYLIMICILKQSLNTSCIQKILPPDMDEQTLSVIYGVFTEKYRFSVERFISQVKYSYRELFNSQAADTNAEGHFLIETAINANLYGILTEKIAGMNIDEEKS